MKRLHFLLIILLIASNLISQDLDNKKKQLDDLKQEIEKQNEIIEEKEKEKAKTIGTLESAKKKKKDVENKIKKLDNSEKVAKQKLNETISRIDKAKSNLLELNILCEKEFTDLFYIHYNEENAVENQIERKYMSDLLHFTLEEIFSLQDTKNVLELDKQDKKFQYEDVISDKKSTQKKKTEYESEIKYIEKDITRIDVEKKELEEEKKRLEEDASALDELIARLQSELTADYYSYEFSESKLNWPVEGEVIRTFGEHKSDEYKVTLQNNGIDIAVKEGTPVHVIDAGVVAFAEWYSGSGKLVIINHQNGFYSLYSHNSALLVSKGDRVNKDQEIALSGKTGTTDRFCLHFEIRKHGTPVDPLEFLK
ncbi:murein hydrolase activator EnvC family protein [Candidatus Cloacimonadota bacterium]